jgi:hypothetical protein
MAAAICMLILVSCDRKPAEEPQKAPEPAAKASVVKVVLPAKPVGKELEFGIYWTRDSHSDAEVGLTRAKGIVTVPGDGSPPSGVIGLSYRYELGETINLVPGDGRKVKATISPDTKAVVLKIVVKVLQGRPASDPADYCAFLIDAEGQALASKEFSTRKPKGDSFRVPLVLPLSGLKSESTIRLVITEAKTDRGIVIPLSARSPTKAAEESSGGPK